jgi:hypothetical protein
MTSDPSGGADPTSPEPTDESIAWRRALGLFLVTLATGIVQPTLLVAVPFLVLAAFRGIRGGTSFAAIVVAMMVVMLGPRNGTWFIERGWALTVGGIFAAVSLWRPGIRLLTRGMLAVGGAIALTGVLVLVRSGAWEAIDWAVSDHLMAAYADTINLMEMAGGETVSAALVSALYRTAEMQMAVFPALVALESMAGIGVAWWLYVRLLRDEAGGLAPVRSFRFNDHLIWLMLGGLFLMLAQLGDPMTRVGANLAVFMSALYALRGMGVVLFVSGGLSYFGYAILTVGLLIAPWVVIGSIVLFGIADTWLDLRERVGSLAT